MFQNRVLSECVRTSPHWHEENCLLPRLISSSSLCVTALTVPLRTSSTWCRTRGSLGWASWKVLRDRMVRSGEREGCKEISGDGHTSHIRKRVANNRCNVPYVWVGRTGRRDSITDQITLVDTSLPTSVVGYEGHKGSEYRNGTRDSRPLYVVDRTLSVSWRTVPASECHLRLTPWVLQDKE